MPGTISSPNGNSDEARLNGTYLTPFAPPSVLGAYGSAVKTQGSDYDSIMNALRAQYTNSQFNPPAPITSSSVAPINYSTSPDVASTISSLKNFATNGGYSDADIANIRARDISPIRSIYASAQNGLARSKVLNNGYSPNYGAVEAKLARDAADQIGATTTNANAGIAEQVQQGKLAALNPLASLTSSEEANNLNVAKTNADITSQNAGRNLSTSEFNTNTAQQNQARQLQILQQQQSLYGTNPALVNTFGNQALNTQEMNQNQNQFNTKTAQTNNLARLAAAGRL